MAAEVPTRFVGQGWAFPVALAGEGGGIAVSAGERGVLESIWLILATAKGERPMRPDFGCGIHDLVFAVNDATTAGRVAQEVHEALVLWEPRVAVLDVAATPSDDEPGVLLIRVSCRVRSTNSRFNLVYPFYLDEGVAR